MTKRILICALMLGAMGAVNAAWAEGRPAAAPVSGEEGLRAAIFQMPAGTPPAVRTSSTCPVFKWDRSCSASSEQDCQASCGSCSMCLDVIQFYPCVYECSCSC